MGRLIGLPLLYGVSFLLGLLPRSGQIFLADRLGDFLGWIGLRRSVVESNLGIVFPALGQEQKEKVIRDYYRHFGNLVLEILLLFGPFRKFLQRYSELQGMEYYLAVKAQGRPVLFVSSHVGNWEVMVGTGATLGKMPLMMVTKRIKPAWLHEAIEKRRRLVGVQAAYEPRTLQSALKHLRKGCDVGLVIDQYSGPPVGYRVPFFGKMVGTSSVAAILAKRTGAALLPVVCHRAPKGRWTVEIRPEIRMNEHASESSDAEWTATLVKGVEQDIRSYPEQWLWIHRRFKGDLGPLLENEWKQRPRS